MLTIVIEDEIFDEEHQTFDTINTLSVDFEHSLISLSKWESKHQKPFLGLEKKTYEETFDYLKCMIVSPNIDPDVVYRFSNNYISKIQTYIDSAQSATTFGSMPQRQGPGETITSELIYYWMVAFNIPFECQHWHLNRLFSLIRICNIKNSKPKKLSRHEIAQRNREINERRRAEMNTSG